MLLLAIVPSVVSLATSVLAYGRPMVPYHGHYDLVGAPPSEPLPSDLMKEIDELLDKIFNISSEESEPSKTDTTDPWANINIDPYMAITTDDEWCPHGEGNYCGELTGRNKKFAQKDAHVSQQRTLTAYPAYNVDDTGFLVFVTNTSRLVQPAEYDDHCEAESDCPHGDGMYCGRTIGRDLHHLYRCNSGVIKDMGYCPNGCEQTANGVSDYCRYVNASVQGFSINAASLQKLKSHVGFSSNMHQGYDYIWQIGYGHLCEPYEVCQSVPVPVNETFATTLLAEDLKEMSTCVCKLVHGKDLNDNQFGALVNYAYTSSDGCQDLQSKSLSNTTSPSEIFNDDSWGEDLRNLWQLSSQTAAPC
ncbi:hypothetical protein INT44_008232 [Umbelopsis vinacea]|uniref:Uncharacterized protein n=1 Tax=Umbelopsis vinacea TaxID=44442 RepID=A0A8H7PPT5_9FUNG|nr:hypothetical protein INT44_008232 [Umbelopsis vinacea]